MCYMKPAKLNPLAEETKITLRPPELSDFDEFSVKSAMSAAIQREFVHPPCGIRTFGQYVAKSVS